MFVEFKWIWILAPVQLEHTVVTIINFLNFALRCHLSLTKYMTNEHKSEHDKVW